MTRTDGGAEFIWKVLFLGFHLPVLLHFGVTYTQNPLKKNNKKTNKQAQTHTQHTNPTCLSLLSTATVHTWSGLLHQGRKYNKHPQPAKLLPISAPKTIPVVPHCTLFSDDIARSTACNASFTHGEHCLSSPWLLWAFLHKQRYNCLYWMFHFNLSFKPRLYTLALVTH